MKAKKLTPGVSQAHPAPHEERRRVGELRATVAEYLPGFASAVAAVSASGGDMVTIHQDAFAAGYHDDEYLLLGMAIKFAGLSGVAVMVTGKNQETC